MPDTASRLRDIKTFEELVQYLEEELDWPLTEYPFEQLTFEYSPTELGLKEQDAAKVKAIHQLRPLHHNQPWGIFFVEFENKRMPVVVLRRILSHLVLKKRASANRAQAAAWHLDDLLFISAFGDQSADQREIAFAHFHQETGDLPTLRVLGWDGADTPLKLDHVAATLKDRLRWPSDPGDADAWRRQWSPAFRHRLGHVIRTADALAERLALLARGIRAAARTLMNHESERGPLRRLHKAFQTALIHDLSEADFADTYAQTITYGLLTAAISRTEMSEGRYGTALVAGNVTDMVPITNPFLREMLQTFLQAGGRKGGINFDELGIQDVVELLRGDETDLPAILRDFGNRTRGEDPVMHFYEHFLAAYDKKLKVKRGIFYTPQPVVSYIVRSVHKLLQTEFGLEDGLASTITWGEMAARHPGLNIPDGVVPDLPFVQILDPATGTATFLVEVIEVIHQTLTAKWKQQRLTEAQQSAAWNDYVPKHLLPRLYGYELMMAPYAIAHMKIGLKLYETDYRFGSSERVRVYLTNALEPASDDSKQRAFAEWAPALALEAQAVNAVKRQQRFTVVVGNPPYSGHSANKGEWIGSLVRSYYQVDSAPLGERQPKWLQDDYVKFIRFGQWRIEETGTGILAMITNHGYLDNPTFRGMRQQLMQTFSEICVLDLHGSTKKKDTAPDGSKDENVFDIQQGVAICLMVKRRSATDLAKVNHSNLHGLRSTKYELLATSDLQSIEWHEVAPRSPFYLFTPQDADLRREYDNGWKITEAFATNNVGFVSARDGFVVDFDIQPLRARIEEFRSSEANISTREIESRYSLKDTSSWNVKGARTKIRANRNWTQDFARCLYRPFDNRHIYYSLDLLERPVYQIQRHMLIGKNLGLILPRRVETVGPWQHVMVSRNIIDHVAISLKTIDTLLPLYLYSTEDTRPVKQAIMFDAQVGPGGRRPNHSPKFIADVEARLGLRFIPDGTGDLKKTFGPEDMFHYAYAVFHSPTYRARYAEFLKIDFPRLPLTGSLELFRALAALGGELVALHLLESPKLDKHITTYAGPAKPEVEKVSYAGNTVWLDKAQTRGFRGVPEDVWNFHIGGYQVCEKWLKDRGPKKGNPGRTLTPEDIEHYQRIVVALHETIRLMGEIDEAIEAHGGWPMG